MAHRILSLDGGGTWAMLEAMALRELFGDVGGRAILARFDLAVANSGGAIVLGGLVEDMTPSQIIDLFNNPMKRQSIFVKTSMVESLLAHIPIFPKYSAAGKLQGLKAAYGATGDQYLENLPGLPGWPNGPAGAPVKILIVGFDYDQLRASFFRSYATSQGATADETSLTDAVHASSNAPVTYFDAPAQFGGRRYWDGAMAGYNNPLMAGLIDLMAEDIPAGQIRALSLGTGTVKLVPAGATVAAPADLAQPRTATGVVADLAKAAGCINDDPPDDASYAAHVIINSANTLGPGASGAVVRLSPILRPILQDQAWSLPTGLTQDQFDQLKVLAMDAVDQPQVDLITALGQAWLGDGVKNQPIRMRSDDLSCAIGDDVYSLGKKRWAALDA